MSIPEKKIVSLVAVPSSFDLVDMASAVRNIRELHRLTQRQLADMLGISGAAISQIETGKAQPSAETLEALYNQLGWRLTSELTGGVHGERVHYGLAHATDNVSAIHRDSPGGADLLTPMLTQYVHAGEATPTIEDEAQWFNVTQHYRDTITVTVAGDSMRDAGIEDGDRVVVRLKPTFNNGDIVLAYLNGTLMLKGITKDRDGITWLVPANEAYAPIAVQPQDHFEVRGTVVELIRKARRGWMHTIISARNLK